MPANMIDAEPFVTNMRHLRDRITTFLIDDPEVGVTKARANAPQSYGADKAHAAPKSRDVSDGTHQN